MIRQTDRNLSPTTSPRTERTAALLHSLNHDEPLLETLEHLFGGPGGPPYGYDHHSDNSIYRHRKPGPLGPTPISTP